MPTLIRLDCARGNFPRCSQKMPKIGPFALKCLGSPADSPRLWFLFFFGGSAAPKKVDGWTLPFSIYVNDGGWSLAPGVEVRKVKKMNCGNPIVFLVKQVVLRRISISLPAVTKTLWLFIVSHLLWSPNLHFYMLNIVNHILSNCTISVGGCAVDNNQV